MTEFTSDLRHMARADNVVADCLSRPPEELSLPRSTQVAGVKVPAGSLATPEARDGSTGASSGAAAAVVPAIQQGPIRWGELARDQLTCQETQEVLTSNTCLLLKMVVGPTCGVTPLPGPSGRWCQPPRGGPSSSRSTSSPTQGSGPHGGWWPPALSGQALQLMWWPGARSVRPATTPR